MFCHNYLDNCLVEFAINLQVFLKLTKVLVYSRVVVCYSCISNTLVSLIIIVY